MVDGNPVIRPTTLLGSNRNAFIKRKNYDTLARPGTDIGMQADQSYTQECLQLTLQNRSALFDEFLTHLLDQVSPPVGSGGLGNFEFCLNENFLETNQHHVFNNKDAGFQRPPPEMILFKADDDLTDFRFQFAFGLHQIPRFRWWVDHAINKDNIGLALFSPCGAEGLAFCY